MANALAGNGSSKLSIDRKGRLLSAGSLLIVVVFVWLHSTQAQSQKNQDETVRLKVHLVTTDVMVKDKKGKHITDLKAEDFTVFENGVEQKVEFFDPPLSIGGETSQPKADDQGKWETSAGRPMNVISLVLDGQTTDPANLNQVREGTIKYINERITNADAVGVFAVTNGLRLLQRFTKDKAKLISAVENAYVLAGLSKYSEGNQVAEELESARAEVSSSGDVNLPQTQAAAAQGPMAARAMIAARALQQFIKLRSQLSVQQARPVLAALGALCEAQRAIPGKKTLVLFSQGFVTSAILDWQVQSVIDLANRANVAIYIVDSAGLAASAPRSGSLVPDSPLAGISALTTSEDRIRATGGENVFDHVRHEGLNRESDILFRISGDTGGEFIKGTNDIAKGLGRIDQEIRSRYTLAYYSTNPNFDGSFRKLKVEVRRPESHPVYRSGYYAISNGEIVMLSPDDKKLLANFAAAEANPALPLFMKLSPFRSEGGNYTVPMSIEVAPNAIRFDRKADKQLMQLDVVGVIRDADQLISRLGGSFQVALSAEQYRQMLTNNIFYRQDMELAPGAYNIELIVRDRLSGKLAAKKEELILPAADAELSTSGVVLSRLALPAKNQQGTGVNGDVFNQGGVQIRPSASREFRAADNLIIFFEVYNAATNPETGKPLVRVTVTLVKDNKAAARPIDYVLTEVLPEQVPHLMFSKYISLAKLTAGRYMALIELKDMVTHKPVTRQESFVITQ